MIRELYASVTTADGPDGHRHVGFFDGESLDGETTTDSDHAHQIARGRVLPAGATPHTHRLVPALLWRLERSRGGVL